MAISHALAGEGAALILVGRNRNALARAIKALPGPAEACAGDVRRPADVRGIFQQVRRRRRRLDILVNNAGVFTYKPFANCSAYTASKFGALGFTRVLRKELRALGIRVTAVLPGVADTAMLRAFGNDTPRSKVLQPEDVARTVLEAILQPGRATVEEIAILPSSGAL